MITVYPARKVITLNPSNPFATHVAVRDGMILGVGTRDEVIGWGDHVIDDTFAHRVIVPGFVEGHAHVMAGSMLQRPYVGFFDRPLPDGRIAPGIRSYDALVLRLKEQDAALADPVAPLIAEGFDPIYFPDQPRLNRHHLDEVSVTRPIFIHHANGHLATVNSVMLRLNGITADLRIDGIGRDAAGEPDGELREAPAMSLCRTAFREIQRSSMNEAAIRNFAALARNAGITTCTDLGGISVLSATALERWRTFTADDDFPLRVVQYNLPAMPGTATDFEAVAAAFVKLRKSGTDRLRFPGVKFVLDGSIQGFTALLNPPGYFRGDDHGQLLAVPDQLVDWLLPFHRAGLSIHMHCNGNRTQDLAIETIEALLRIAPHPDHRHTITHAQLTTQAQLRKMARLGLCANFFTNHLWYWGDQHYEITVGPERANALEPCASALREGVPFSFHSDAGVTPLGPLHTMWCAVNRVTPKGRVLGPLERITPAQALKAATIDAAFQLHLDHEIGSLEAGKRADFTVLEDDPLTVDPMAIRDISVWGTVLGGRPFKAAG